MLNFSIDQESCIKCGVCAQDCPVKVIEMVEDAYPHVADGKAEECIRCQHCFAVCPTAALSILGLDPKESIELKGNLPSPEQMEALVKGRRSVRKYKQENVDRDVLDRLMEITLNAPTGKNNQDLLLTVVDDIGSMNKLRAATYAAIKEQFVGGVVPEGMEFFASIVDLYYEKGVDILYRGAPHLIVASSPKDGPCPEADCHISLSYFELMAQSMGLGTIWDGFAKWVMTLIAPKLQELIELPEGHIYGYAMAFGNPDVKYFRTVQRAQQTQKRLSL